jgi:hypothetical protein
MSDDPGTGMKLVLTAIVVVLMVPGLIIEPGPFSEMAAVGLLMAIWFGDGDASDVQDAAEGAA